MNASRKLLAAAVLAALSSPALAEIEFDVIGGSEITFEGQRIDSRMSFFWKRLVIVLRSGPISLPREPNR